MNIPKGRIKQNGLLVCILAHALDLGPSFTSSESNSYFNGYFIFFLKCIYILKKGKT